MKITKRTITTNFQESIENYRFNGSFTEEDNNVVSLNASVDLITDSENDLSENLGYINIRKVNGRDVKTIYNEIINGISTLINTLSNDKN